ncbi:hypothetical protein PENNAL_c0011G01508 [Penicillium nalgiovense]|uniref:GST C-terminal domain-containing protein n=1 Tax=Penicillium nalgiovense TaxID=60175 RepID=A0A1V6YTV0_PENNA|nr:hypothetical protein PENNAL_c0011G01508 [Penicillium nalgiovense]
MQLPSAKPTLHYLDIGSLGHGEVIRLFLRDAGVEFNDIRYPYDSSWPATSTELKEKGLSVTGKVPVLDSTASTHSKIEWVKNIGNVTENFKNEFVPNYYSLLEGSYAQHDGPYLLGEKITYADFAIYQSIHNNIKIGASSAFLQDHLARFKAAFEARPNIVAYLVSRDT